MTAPAENSGAVDAAPSDSVLVAPDLAAESSALEAETARPAVASVEWLTPAGILRAVRHVVGGVIDLDPCACTSAPGWTDARIALTAADDGLARDWFGAVFMNPPYGREIHGWAAKVRAEVMARRARVVVSLVPARVDTGWWDLLTAPGVGYWSAALLVRGRLRFHLPEQVAAIEVARGALERAGGLIVDAAGVAALAAARAELERLEAELARLGETAPFPSALVVSVPNVFQREHVVARLEELGAGGLGRVWVPIGGDDGA